MPKKWVVMGELASKANSSQFIRPGLIIKSQKARTFEELFPLQIKPKPEDCIMEGEVVLDAAIFYKTQRPDLDESLLMDCIQKVGLIKNDRQIREKHIYHAIDKLNPRCEFIISLRINR